MKIDSHIRNWAKIFESQLEETDYPCTEGFPQAEKDICEDPFTGEKLYEDENGVYNHFKDLFQDNGEVEVTQENGIVYISFDSTGYDNDSYKKEGFEEIRKLVQDEISEVNKYEHEDCSVEEDPENEYTLKITTGKELNEDGEGVEDNSKQGELTLKEYVEKAKEENGELQVTFRKVTDSKERTAIFSNTSGKNAHFDEHQILSPEKLKTIRKNHDRVYQRDVKYVGCLVTFPEKITEETPHVTEVYDAEDGTQWQWRKLYIQEIINVKYNGEIKWENNGLYNFNLIGRDGSVTRIVSKEEYDKSAEKVKQYCRKEMEREQISRLQWDKAVELAKTMTDEQCAIELGYAATNGFNYLDEEKQIMVLAIRIKHDWLCRRPNNKHTLKDEGSNPTRGFHHYKCQMCGFGYEVDSSD